MASHVEADMSYWCQPVPPQQFTRKIVKMMLVATVNKLQIGFCFASNLNWLLISGKTTKFIQSMLL